MKIKLLLLLVLGCLVVLSACQPPEVSASLGREFSLRPGQEALVTGEDLRLEFVGVTQDSRCPAGIT